VIFMEPYDPQNPDMPPLINDVVMTEEGLRRFNAEAEAIHKAAQEIGFTGIIDISRPPTPPPKCGAERLEELRGVLNK
jgi:hypothetical protein